MDVSSIHCWRLCNQSSGEIPVSLSPIAPGGQWQHKRHWIISTSSVILILIVCPGMTKKRRRRGGGIALHSASRLWRTRKNGGSSVNSRVVDHGRQSWILSRLFHPTDGKAFAVTYARTSCSVTDCVCCCSPSISLSFVCVLLSINYQRTKRSIAEVVLVVLSNIPKKVGSKLKRNACSRSPSFRFNLDPIKTNSLDFWSHFFFFVLLPSMYFNI